MNKIGIHYAYWTNNWNVDLKKYVKKASDLGFEILEIDSAVALQLSGRKLEELKEVIKDYNIELTFAIALSKDVDISSKDTIIRDKGIAYLKRVIKRVAELEGKQLSGVIFGTWNPVITTEDIDKKAYLERSVESMKEVSKTAENLGVYCNVEAVNRFEQFIINTSEEAVEYVRLVDSPNVKVLLDTFHMNIEEGSFRESIITAGNNLGHFHIGENNRRPPGLGHLPWDEIFKALKEIHYQGHLVMEPFVLKGGNVGKDIKVWRDLSKGMNQDKEIVKALKYLVFLLNKK